MGYQNISNALAATALAFPFQIPLKKIKIGLSSTPILSGRLETIQLNDNKILINDTYNANVSSMITAIKVLETMPGYKMLVVGDMSELGENTVLYHKMIGNTANFSKIDEVLSIGDISHEISQICNNGQHFSNKATLNKYIKNVLLKKTNITILVKGSRNANMEKTVQYIIKESKKNVNLVA